MRIALAVSTYERADALAAVLATVAAQSRLPDEVIVADDGSGETTRAAIRAAEAVIRVPLRHVWQEHRGFRLTRLRNLAIAATTADYLLFIDGDMLLHPHFVADHARIARPGYYTQGVRVPLDAAATTSALRAPAAALASVGTALHGAGLRRSYTHHSPLAARWARRVANTFIAIKGCNQAFWRESLARANGFNEAIEGWGPEDKELCARLAHAGIRRQTLLFGGIAWHLAHPPATREQLAVNLAIYEETLRTRATRCARGLDAHAPPASVR